MSSPRQPRRLDHLVLPVPDLAVSEARHRALGFTVAAEARHPFGTENACVFFSDGTYLEPLAVASREECEAAAIAGNVFVARDRAFRFRNGDNGFSAMVVASPDAEADHERFRRLGMSGGDALSFSRPVKLPDGDERTASFKLAFAGDLRAPDFLAFAVERLNMPTAGGDALTRHANGASGISEIVLSEPNPTDFQYFLQEMADNREVEAHSFGLTIALEGATINVLNPEGMRVWFGRQQAAGGQGDGRGLRGRAIVFRTGDLEALAEHFAAAGIVSRKIGSRLIVDEMPGQGAIYAFEEER